MNNLIRTFLESLHDRIIGSVGSIIGNTFSTYRVAQTAEHQSFLEDLARKYEAEGKTELASKLRHQAARLEVDDPGTEARIVFNNLLGDRSELLGLTDELKPEQDRTKEPSTKKTRRSRKQTGPSDDMGISLD